MVYVLYRSVHERGESFANKYDWSTVPETPKAASPYFLRLLFTEPAGRTCWYELAFSRSALLKNMVLEPNEAGKGGGNSPGFVFVRVYRWVGLGMPIDFDVLVLWHPLGPQVALWFVAGVVPSYIYVYVVNMAQSFQRFPNTQMHYVQPTTEYTVGTPLPRCIYGSLTFFFNWMWMH